ncbi:hypothetical protein ACQP1W_29875 [Spirillospora sp. CA-255316]
MTSAIRSMSSGTKMGIFWMFYGASVLLAIAPPLYLAGSGRSGIVLGIPFSVAYWIFDALLAVGAVWLLWIFENIRGELDDEPGEVAR